MRFSFIAIAALALLKPSFASAQDADASLDLVFGHCMRTVAGDARGNRTPPDVDSWNKVSSFDFSTGRVDQDAVDLRTFQAGATSLLVDARNTQVCWVQIGSPSAVELANAIESFALAPPLGGVVLDRAVDESGTPSQVTVIGLIGSGSTQVPVLIMRVPLGVHDVFTIQVLMGNAMEPPE